MQRNFNFYYPVDAFAHFHRANICLNQAFNIPDGSYLFYASLELRVCIERLLFEYLVIWTIDQENIEKHMKKHRIKDFSNAIFEVEPEFDKKIEYTNFFLNSIGADFEMKTPDKNKLNSIYGKLGKYLHNFKRPTESTQNEEWWDSLIQFLEDSLTYVYDYFKTPRASFKMNEKGLNLYQAYKDGSISKEEIKKRIIEDMC